MPDTIKYFERCFLGSIAIGMVIAVAGDPGLMFFQFIGLAIMTLLILLTSRKKSNIAKWLLTIMFAFGMLIYIPSLMAILQEGIITGLLSIINTLLQCVGLYFLFHKESRIWYS